MNQTNRPFTISHLMMRILYLLAIFCLVGCQGLLSFLSPPDIQEIPSEPPTPEVGQSTAVETPTVTATPSDQFPLREFSSPGKGVISEILQTPDQKYYLYILERTLHLVDSVSLEEVGLIPDVCMADRALFSPDSRYAALQCIPDAVASAAKLVDLKEKQARKYIGDITNGTLKAIEFSRDNRRIVYLNRDHDTGNFYGYLGVWDVESQETAFYLESGHDFEWFVSSTEPAISRDQRFITAGYSDQYHSYLMIWDFESGEILHEIATQSPINSVSFSPDGSRIAIGDEGGMVHLYNPISGQETKAYGGFQDSILEIEYDNISQLKVQVRDQLPQVLDLRDGSIKETLPSIQVTPTIHPLEEALFKQGLFIGNTHFSGDLEFSPDGSQLAIGDKRLTLWDTESGNPLQLFNPFSDQTILDLAFSPDGGQLAALGNDGEVVVLDLENGKELYRGETIRTTRDAMLFERLNDTDEPMSFSPDGKKLAIGVGNGWQLIELATNTSSSNIDPLREDLYITDLVFSQDGAQLHAAVSRSFEYSYSQTMSVQIWDVNNQLLIDEIILPEIETDLYENVDLSWPFYARSYPDGDQYSIELWNLESRTYQKTAAGLSARDNSFSQDGKVLYSKVGGDLIAWRSIDGTFIGKTLETIYARVFTISPDGNLLAFVEGEDTTGLPSILDISELTAQADQPAAPGSAPEVQAYAPEAGNQETDVIPSISLGSERSSGKAFFTPLIPIAVANAGQVREVGHFSPGTINSLRWQADGSRLVLAGSRSLASFMPSQGMTLLTERSASFTSTATRADGHLLASGVVDGAVFVYDANLDQVVAGFKGGGQPALDPKGRYLVYQSADDELVTYDLEANQPLAVLPNDQEIMGIVSYRDFQVQPVFSPDGNYVAGVYHGITIRVWNAKTGAIYNAVGGPDGKITDLSFSPDGRYILAAGGGSAWIWNLRPGGEPQEYELYQGKTIEYLLEYEDSVTSVAISPNNRLLAVGTSQGEIRIYNLLNDSLERILNGHAARVEHLAFNPTGNRLASGDRDGDLIVWNIANGALVSRSNAFSGPIEDLVLRDDGSLAAIGDSTVWVVNPAEARLQQITSSYSGKVLAASPDGKYLAIYQPYKTYLADGTSGEVLHPLEGEAQEVSVDYRQVDEALRQFYGAVFSHDSQVLATFGAGGLWLHDIGEGIQLRHHFEGSVSHQAIFSPDDLHLVFTPNELNSRMSIFDLENDYPSRELDIGWLDSITYNMMGDKLAFIANLYDVLDTISIYDTDSNELVHEYQLESGDGLTRSAFSLYDAIIAVGQEDGSILLLDTTSGTLLIRLTGHTGGITSLTFTRDGMYLLAGSQDGTVSVWAAVPD